MMFLDTLEAIFSILMAKNIQWLNFCLDDTRSELSQIRPKSRFSGQIKEKHFVHPFKGKSFYVDSHKKWLECLY